VKQKTMLLIKNERSTKHLLAIHHARRIVHIKLVKEPMIDGS